MMETRTGVNKLKNRTQGINKVHTYINKVVPELLTELEKGFKLTTNMEFFKKDQKRLRAVIDKYGHFRAYLSIDSHSIILRVDDHYQDSEYSCNYYDKSIFLFNQQNKVFYEFKSLEMITELQLIEAQHKKKQLIKKQREIGSELSSINLLLGE